MQDSPTRVPLTMMQRLRLFIEIVPFFAFVLIFVFSATLMDDLTGRPAPLVWYLFLGLVLAVVGSQAVQRLRDLIAGVALVQDDLLENLRRAQYSGGGRRTPYGHFAQLGKMRMLKSVFYQSHPGSRYRVYYSPVSKIVWKMEQLPDYPQPPADK